MITAKNKKAVILGAGPCGLTAAWHLAENGVSVTIIEKENQIGGLCKTIRKDGYQFDLGGHRFISEDNGLITEIKNLMNDELLTCTRKSVIRFHDRQYDYPLNLQNIISVSSFWMNLQFAGSYTASMLGINKKSTNKYSFEEWIDLKFGKSANNFFFKPYTEKLWGIPSSKLSDDWAEQRIPRLDGKNILKKFFGFSKNIPRTYALKYLYPKKGIGSIFETMAKEIKYYGGKIITNSTPIHIDTIDKRILKIWIKDKNNTERPVEADSFLSTIPLDNLATLLGHSPHPTLSYRSLRFLNITLNRQNFSPNTWFYIPEGNIIMTRIQEPKRRSPFSAPPGKTSILLEIPCERGDKTWTMDDKKLYDKVAKDLKKIGFNITDDTKNYFSTFAANAYPRYEMGYKKNVTHLLNIINKHQNLETLGRQGLFRYIFMDTAMLMGKMWANAFLKQTSTKHINKIGEQPVLLEARSIAG